MAIHGLNHVNIRTRRPLLDALRDFYRDVLGLQEGFRPPFAGFGYWLYADDKAVIHLYEAEPEEIRPTDVANTLDHFAFDCTGRTEVEATLNRHGTAYRKTTVPLTNQVQLFLHDPAGNHVELNFATPEA